MKNSKLRIPSSLAAVMLLTACSPDVQVLEDTAPRGGPFTQALAKDYKVLASEAQANAEYQPAELYARQGLEASGGDVPGPIDPGSRDIPGVDIHDLAGAFSLLHAVKRQGVQKLLPEAVAAMQVNYDCWAKETSFGMADEAASCKAKFFESFQTIRDEMAAAEMAALEIAAVEGIVDIAPTGLEPEVPRVFMTFFENGSSHPGKDAAQVVAAAVESAAALGAQQILVLGYTDAPGSYKGNIHLSQLRAKAVKKLITDMGVPSDKVLALGQGSADPLVNTSGSDQSNRRVVIILR